MPSSLSITSWANAGGIAGTSLGQGMKIIECVNYANIEVYGVGIHKTADSDRLVMVAIFWMKAFLGGVLSMEK